MDNGVTELGCEFLGRTLGSGRPRTVKDGECWKHSKDMGVSENVVYPIVPNGFADHYPYEKWLAIIGNINPTFSDKPIWNYDTYNYPLVN